MPDCSSTSKHVVVADKEGVPPALKLRHTTFSALDSIFPNPYMFMYVLASIRTIDHYHHLAHPTFTSPPGTAARLTHNRVTERGRKSRTPLERQPRNRTAWRA